MYLSAALQKHAGHPSLQQIEQSTANSKPAAAVAAMGSLPQQQQQQHSTTRSQLRLQSPEHH